MFLPKFHFLYTAHMALFEVSEGWVHRKKSQLGHHPVIFSFLLITNPILVLDHVN